MASVFSIRVRLAAICMALAAFWPGMVHAAPVAADVVVTGTVLTDNGDNDGWADANEMVGLRLRVRNLMDRRVDDLVALLSTADPSIECVTRSVIYIGSLAAGEERVTDQGFDFKVADISRGEVAEELSAALVVRIVSDDLGYALVPDQSVVLDLDLDATAGSGATTFFESFEEGLGAFTTMHLDQTLNPPASDLANLEAGVSNADGHRCQYSDPEWEGSNSSGNSQGEQCFPAPNGASDEFFFDVTTDRAFTGDSAMHFGVFLDVARGFTTPNSQLEAVMTAQPINLAWGRACSASLTKPCNEDIDCPPGDTCLPLSPGLSIKHQASFIDHRSVSAGTGRSADRGIVSVQLATATGDATGPWVKVYPYLNIYDSQPNSTYFNCSFDPTDDGNTETDFFDPLAANRILGPSSTCYPQFNFAHEGSTTGEFDPAAIGDATHGPGLAGEKGEGTWIESQFSLDRFRGRRIRLRFLTTGIKLGGARTWEQAFNFNPDPGDDGWFVDDVTISDTLLTAANVSVDDADNSGLPELTDNDQDGLACDNCPAEPNAAQADMDGDGLGDACDPCPSDRFNDLDQDGICCSDGDNCCTVANGTQADSDGDGVGDACDNCPQVPNPDQADAFDDDGIGDLCDDGDGDGVADGLDNCPFLYSADQGDRDADGVGDACDNCVDIHNPSQDDQDADGLGDFCDACALDAAQADGDGDGVPNACDNCPQTINPALNDRDQDGVGDACDNCPNDANGTQADIDQDGLGDVCDPCPLPNATDTDGDGVLCEADNCPDVSNSVQGDFDFDGLGDACDPCVSSADNDADGDGVCEFQDTCPGLFNLGPSTSVRVSGEVQSYWGVMDFAIGPDGQTIVYVADQNVSRREDVYQVSLESLEIRRLSPPGQPGASYYGIVIDATGARAFAYGDPFESRRWRVVGMDLAGSYGFEANRSLSPNGLSSSFKVGPAGETVIHLTRESLGCSTDYSRCLVELFAIPAEGGKPVRLHPSLAPDGDAGSFVIAPDGEHVVYTADQDTLGKFELYRVRLSGGLPRKLSHDLADGQDVTSIAVGGRTVAYLAIDGGVRSLFAVPLVGGAPVFLSEIEYYDLFAVSQDGSTVVFEAGDTLSSVPAQGGDVVPLMPVDSFPTWRLSPDGSTVLVITDAEVEDRDELFSVPVAGGPVTKLSDPEPPEFSEVAGFAISPDSSGVLYRADYGTSHGRELFYVPAVGGTPVVVSGPVTSSGVEDFAFGPDSSAIVYVARHGESGRRELFVTNLEPDPDGDGILELCDVCPGIYDPFQVDGDDDGFGALCDCRDDEPGIYPGAAEVNDGQDNQCAGDPGFGQADEVALAGFLTSDNTRYGWPAQNGAELYEVARASSANFEACEIVQTVDAFHIDRDVPPAGQALFYLVRAASPFPGSWGLGAAAAERQIDCP